MTGAVPGPGGFPGTPQASPRRRSGATVLAAAVSFAVVLVSLAVAGWQLGWPSAVFGAKSQPVGLIAPAVSSSAPATPSAAPTQTQVTPTQTPAPVTSTPVEPETEPSSAVVSPPPVYTPTPVSSPPGDSQGTGGGDSGPSAVVMDYFAAINAGDYEQAWALGGDNTGAGSLANFESGFDTTANDTVQIIAVNGDVVTAALLAQQTDGTVKVFHGTYTVEGGTIVAFDVKFDGYAPTDGE